MFFVTIW